MKLVILEGPVDLQFFKWFVLKQLNGQDISRRIIRENKEIMLMFKNLISRNPEMARVEFLHFSDDILVLLSVGGKDNFEKVAKGIRGLVDSLLKKEQNIESVIFIGDKDAKHSITRATNIAKESLSKTKRKKYIKVSSIVITNYLEDLVLELIELIKNLGENKSIEKDLEVLEDLLKIVEEKYTDDSRLYKRKLSIAHAILGPGCYRELFDNLFELFDDKNQLLKSLDVLNTFYELLNK